MAMDAQTYEYLADSFEFPDRKTPIPNFSPPTAGSVGAQRRSYFLDNQYPYEQRLELREYYHDKHALQVELVKLQNWVKERGKKCLWVFEGRDAAGKGSTIKRFMEHLNPRGARVVALDKPTQNEQGQWYFQRYLRHLPGPGEIVFFDRSWYNRAGVERVMEFCTEAEYLEFFRQAPEVERMLVNSGILLIKFYFSVSREEQQRRFDERRTNLLKHWKLSPMDLAAEQKWDDYTTAKEEMFRVTHSAHAPWTMIKSDDKMRARLCAMRHVLRCYDYDHKDEKAIGIIDPYLLAPASEIYPAVTS